MPITVLGGPCNLFLALRVPYSYTSPREPKAYSLHLILLQMGPPCSGLRPGFSLSFDSCLGLPETPPVVIFAIRREAHLQQLARAEGLPHTLQEALLCIQDGDGSLTDKGNSPPAGVSLPRISLSPRPPTTICF